MDREKTCQLLMAGDMIMMLVEGILRLSQIKKCIGKVVEARLENVS